MDTFFPSSNISPETKNMMLQDHAGRMTNAAISGMGTVASAGLSFGGYAAGLGLIGGTALGMVGAPIVGAYFNNGQEQAEIQGAYSKYLQRESYRFINSRESNNDRGYSGFSQNESQQAASFLRGANKDFFISDREMMNLTQQYTESGMLRDVKDLEGFRDKIKELTKNVKSGALMLNETYQSITSLMSEMKKMGISEGSYTNIMSMGKIVGAELGKSGSETTRSLLGMAGGLTQGTGLSNEQYVGRLADTVTYTNYMYEALKGQPSLNAKEAAAKNYINNNGGVEAVSGMINQIQDSILDKNKDVAAAFFDYNKSNNTWGFNQDKYNTIISGAEKGLYDLNALNDLGVSNLEKYGDLAIKDWQDNYHIYMGNELEESQISNFSRSLTMAYSNEVGANPNDLSSGLSFMMQNMSADERALYANYMETVNSQGDGLILQQKNMASFQNINASMQANNPTLWRSIKYGWEGVKEDLGEWGADFSDTMSNMYTGINEALYGKHYTSLDFKTKTDWSTTGMEYYSNDFYDAMSQTKDNLKKFKSQGYDINDDTIGLFNVTNPNQKTYQYMREIIANGSSLGGIVGENYGTIQKVGENSDLSETILAALVKFTGRSEAKTLFGADASIIEKLSRENSAKVSGSSTSTLEQKLEVAAGEISKLVGLYGGNEDLAMKAFYGGQQTVDDQLKAMGYDVDKLRNLGNQGILSNANANQVVINSSNYSNFSGAMGSMGADGFDASNPGVSFHVKGSPVDLGKDYQYLPEYDYLRGSKDNQKGEDKYYDIVHQVASQMGLSPNALATLMITESSGYNFDKNGNIKVGGSGEIGLTQIMPYASRYEEFKGQTITLNDGKTYTIGSDPALDGMDSESAFKHELAKEEVNLYVGGKIYNSHLKNATNDGSQNPYLAYAGFNGGQGYVDFLEKAASAEGVDFNKLTDSDINTLSSKYAGSIPVKGLSAADVVGKGRANTNFGRNLRDDQIKPTSSVVDAVETEYDITLEKQIKDAITNASVNASELAKKFSVTDQTNKAIIDLDSITSIQNQYDAATKLTKNESLSMGRFGSKKTWTDYEKEVDAYLRADDPGIKGIGAYGTNAIKKTYLTSKMEDEILFKFAQSAGLDVTSVTDLTNPDKRVSAYKATKNWYDAQYRDIERFTKGEVNTWDSLSMEEKTQNLETMNLLINSTFGSQDGVTLELKDVLSLTGKGYAGAFNANDLNTMNKIGNNGNYYGDRNYNYQVDGYEKGYENVKKWIQKNGSVDGEYFIADKVTMSGIMNSTAEEAETMLKAEKKKIMQSQVSGYNPYDINQQSNYMLRNPDKIGDPGNISGLDAQIAAIYEQIDKSGDLATLGDAVVGVLGMDKSKAKEFREDMRYDFLSQGSEKLRKEDVGAVQDAFQSGYAEVIETISDELKTNLEAFSKSWAQYIPEEVTSTYLKDYLSVGEDGAFTLKTENYEEIAGAILNVISASGSTFGGEEIGAAVKDSNETLTGAINDGMDEAENAATKIADTMRVINEKVDTVAAEVKQIKIINPFLNH
jgi:hypothetical protein